MKDFLIVKILRIILEILIDRTKLVFEIVRAWNSKNRLCALQFV